MDMLSMLFPVSGVTTSVFLPPLTAFAVSVFTSLAGMSGAFLLLPFQMSVLGFTGPAVSATNLVYNIVAVPSGAYQYFREGRMTWPLAWVIIAGTLPGIFIGCYIRILYLPDPHIFKFFVGLVLLVIGGKLLYEITKKGEAGNTLQNTSDNSFDGRARIIRKRIIFQTEGGRPPMAAINTLSWSMNTVEYEFLGKRFRFSVPAMILLAFIVGIIGGAYGIGGGVIIAPFCVIVFRLPIHTVGGAALLATFVTSVVGVISYSMLPVSGGGAASPDWALGSLFGIGGFIGMYVGARLQKYVSQQLIKLILGIIVVVVAAGYLVQFFML